MNTAINRTGDLTLLDVKDLGQHYAKTLSHWRTNFNTAQNEIKPLGFDDRFARKWNYYLCYCEAAFKMRNINVLQLLYSRPNNLSY
jgi:cyclopropane-fatty-acyl-phospholipid synthase